MFPRDRCSLGCMMPPLRVPKQPGQEVSRNDPFRDFWVLSSIEPLMARWKWRLLQLWEPLDFSFMLSLNVLLHMAVGHSTRRQSGHDPTGRSFGPDNSRPAGGTTQMCSMTPPHPLLVCGRTCLLAHRHEHWIMFRRNGGPTRLRGLTSTQIHPLSSAHGRGA